MHAHLKYFFKIMFYELSVGIFEVINYIEGD